MWYKRAKIQLHINLPHTLTGTQTRSPNTKEKRNSANIYNEKALGAYGRTVVMNGA